MHPQAFEKNTLPDAKSIIVVASGQGVVENMSLFTLLLFPLLICSDRFYG